MPRDGKEICQPCRVRKIRCDGKKPICSRCSRLDRDCEYVKRQARSIAFRHSELSALTFASATDHQSTNDTPISQNSAPEVSSVTSESCVVTRSESSLHHQPHQHPSVASPESTSRSNASLLSPDTTFTEPFSEINYGNFQQHLSPVSVRDNFSSRLHSEIVPDTVGTTSCYEEKPRQLTRLEGDLLHFYVQNIGPWLDVTSPERLYTYAVPRLSLHCPLLLYAIMACSAHISRVLGKTNTTELAECEQRYQAECVRLLIPVLDYAVQEDAVLATIIILRMLEQFHEYEFDRQYHLVPAAFARSDTMCDLPIASTQMGNLYQAAFYSYVRADIRMAILGQCHTKLSVALWPLDESSPSSDADWANCMTWLLVHTINLCYTRDNEDIPPDVLPYEELVRRVDSWKDNLPNSFEPYYCQNVERDPFLVVRLLCPWHIVGLQFYHASKILLATYGLNNLTFANALEFNKYLETKVLMHVRMLCAISFSNDHFGCRINASHLIALGARFFTGREEQWRILKYFEMLQNERAWPSRACQEMLRAAWERE